MGEARVRSRSRAAILTAEPMCIYCGGLADTVEHMPPIGMFKERSRPSGMEFPTCRTCNVSTSTADLVASFFGLVHPTDSHPSLIKAPTRLYVQIAQHAPRVVLELNLPGKSRDIWPSVQGVRRRLRQLIADGPAVRAYLDVFATKMAFALYREHVGQALPPTGRTFARWFLNNGLAQKDADVFLSKMPIEGGLRQGTFTSDGQFSYRYNCDDHEVMAALMQFHRGLYIFTIATARPEYYLRDWRLIGETDSSASPGDLLSMLPKL